MKKVNELKAGVLLSYVNLGITCIIPLVYTPIMLRILGRSEYGLYSLSNSVISYLTMLNFGMGAAVIRYVTKARTEGKQDEINSTVGLFILVYTILAGVVLLVGCILSLYAHVFFAKGLSAAEITKLRVLMVIMASSTAITFPVSVFSSVCVSYEKYIFRRLIDMVTTIASPALNLVALFAGKGSVGMAIAGLSIQIVCAPIYVAYCMKRLNVHPSFNNLSFSLLKDIWGFSAFVFLSMIVDMLYWSTDKVLIGALVGSAAVAVYNVGGVFTSMLQNMSSAISNVFTPRVTSMVVSDNNADTISELLIRVGRLQYLIVSFILSGYIVFGKIFIHFWSGDDYMDAYYIALLTMIPLAVPLIQNIAYNTILAQKKHQFRAISYAIIAIVNVISTYLVLPYWGIIGAAVCTGVAFTAGNGIIMNYYYYKVTKLNIPLFWKNIGKMSIVPAIFILIGYNLINNFLQIQNIMSFLIGVCLYSLLYLILTWFVSMNKYERNLFDGMIKSVISR